MAQTNDIAIDLGTSNVIIYMKGKGIVFREPCVVAVDRETNNIIAFGLEAYRMIGRTPANVNIIRPLAQGEMLDFELTSAILRFFVTSVIGKHIIARPRAVMAVPSGVKDMEKKALISSMFEAGIRRTQLMDKNIAAALGAQLNFMGSYGSLVVDISAGCTDLAVLYNSSVSVISSVHIGGDHFDDANPWNRVAKYQADKTPIHVTISGVVTGGVIAMVEGLRGFIPASKVSLSYVEDLETLLNKEMDVQVIDCDVCQDAEIGMGKVND